MIFRYLDIKVFEEEMNEIINQIEELKQMQRFPRYLLTTNGHLKVLIHMMMRLN